MPTASTRYRTQALLPLIILVLGLLPAIAGAEPGDLLSSFGTDGITYEGLGQNHQTKDAILHPTLGLLIATFESQGSFQAKLRLVQMDPETGVILDTITYPNLLDEQRELHLEDDGQGGVIVGASVIVSANDLDVLVFRLTPGLVIDSGFGLRQISFNLDPANGYDELQDLKVLSDGRIVALVEVPTTMEYEAGLVFLNSDGSFDTNISTGGLPDGFAFVPFLEDGDLFPMAMTEDSLGRLWVAAQGSGPSDEKIAVARVLPDASADTTFAGNGSTLLEYRVCVLCPTEAAYPHDMAALDDRAYLAVSTFDSTGIFGRVAVARLNDLGGVDSLFGGWRTIDFTAPGGGDIDVTRPELKSDPLRGGVVLGATVFSYSNGQDYAGIARLGLDGENDPGFGSGAPVVHSFGQGTRFYRAQFAMQGVNEMAGTFSGLRVAGTVESAQDVAVMAIEGFDQSVFADDFESGDLSEWSAFTP